MELPDVVDVLVYLFGQVGPESRDCLGKQKNAIPLELTR
jgi:hypothetical protein